MVALDRSRDAHISSSLDARSECSCARLRDNKRFERHQHMLKLQRKTSKRLDMREEVAQRSVPKMNCIKHFLPGQAVR